ncbi:MAG: TonB-dependent receptor [Cyclobacteriaceae bacterium]|nr:TonB-dependent receptor [Cyclobacteriaceae bacterium]
MKLWRRDVSSLICCTVLSLTLLFVVTPALSQDDSLYDKPFAIAINHGSLAMYIQEIEQRTGVHFSLNPRQVNLNQEIKFALSSGTLDAWLRGLGEQAGFQFEQIEKQIVLKHSRKAQPADRIAWSGYVRDINSGEALIGAAVIVGDQHLGVATNAYGFFSLTLKPGTYDVQVSFIGYKPLVRKVRLVADVQETVLLAEEPPILRSVEVKDLPPDQLEEVQTGKVHVRPSTVQERPALFGEMDVIKSLESVPGVKLHSDGSTFYYVRGGNRDQNLLLLDDAPVYNPSHMLGLFSTVIPDAVGDIQLYKGDMPASLGGRLSSVMDIHTRRGNDQKTQIWGNVGVISTKLGVEGPIRPNKSSFLVTARASRLKWLFELADRNLKQFYFFDLNAKINFSLNARNRIYFSLYNGADHYFNTNAGLQWTNLAGSFRWNHQINSKLFVNSTLAASGYDYSLFVNVADQTRWNSRISNFTLKSDFGYYRKPGDEITFGWSLSGFNMNPGNLLSARPITPPVISIRNSTEWAGYINRDHTVNRNLKLQYGIRATDWVSTGPSFEFRFNNQHQVVDTARYGQGVIYNQYGRLEPRVTVQWALDSLSSLRAGISRSIQNVHLISNSISPFTSLEVWLPSSINIRPETGLQYSVGYYRKWEKSLSVSGEVYYRQMNNLVDYAPHASTLLNPLLESELRFGRGRAYGMEWLLRRESGRFRGWLGYTFSRSLRTFESIDSGQWFSAFSDRPHQINLMISWDTSPRWNLGLTWNYSTGTPYTAPVGFYYYQGKQVPVYDRKNNSRFPDYHRLDLSATWRLNKNLESKFIHSLTFSVYNLYGRKNAVFLNFSKQQQSDGSIKIPSDLLNVTNVASQIFLFQFTPSLSYNFKWL